MTVIVVPVVVVDGYIFWILIYYNVYYTGELLLELLPLMLNICVNATCYTFHGGVWGGRQQTNMSRGWRVVVVVGWKNQHVKRLCGGRAEDLKF